MRTMKELVPAPKSLIAQVMCNSHHHSSAPRRRRRRRVVGGQAGSKLGTLAKAPVLSKRTSLKFFLELKRKT